jgi:(R)-2-hydroxyacyl-CoA dehydratese activating ATPase
MIAAGIDSGSRTLKVVLLEAQSRAVVASGVVDQGVDQDALAVELLERLLAQNGISRGDVAAVVATGYGRKLIDMADATVTEVTCQGRGVNHSVPGVRTVIDIGGQDSKLLRLRPDGTVADFVMNDRCAAGTGRFLEVLATRLGVKLSCLGKLIDRSRTPATISNMCVVFAETEIIGLLASGVAREDIVAGVQASIATRVAAMAGRNLPEPVLFTGGVALVPGMTAALEGVLARPVAVAPQPQLTCALGAAILAAERLKQHHPPPE